MAKTKTKKTTTNDNNDDDHSSCSDNRQNGQEDGVDCGGGCPEECLSGVCVCVLVT